MILAEIIHTLRDKNLLAACFADAGLCVENISCNSKQCGKNTLFFAKGVAFKREYLTEAQANGAVAYIAEKDMNVDLPFIMVSDVRKAMPEAAKVFYGNPASKYKLVGITGTKGKTTVSYMLKNIFDRQYGSERVGIISTNEAFCGKTKYEKSGTTPEALELYKILNGFAKEGAEVACMEVSSQGLWYDRTLGVDFFVGAFLNLAPDHISPTEHKSFEEYKEAKKRLLKQCRYGVVNIDDKYADEIIEASSCEAVYTVSSKVQADFYAKEIILTKSGASFKLCGKYLNDIIIEIRIPGEFNVTNALVAAAVAFCAGCSAESIQRGLLATEIGGRMELYEKNGITVIVDYAHNGLSVEAVLKHARRFYPGAKITCLFGCPGNKAYDRRTEMPESVGKYADFAVLTSDDPENEEPAAILDEVETALKKTPVPYVKIEDRAAAVKFALSNAKAGDVVFLAGKGHETTQKVKGKLVYYKGDLPYAKEILNNGEMKK